MYDQIADLIPLALLASTPLLLVVQGELVMQRSGIINLGVEGMMLVAAMCAVLGGPVAGIGGAAAVALIFGLFTITLRADQIVTGTAINLLAVGMTSFLYREMNARFANPPRLSPDIVLPLAWIVLPAALALLLWNTSFGLRLRACGENPEAVGAAGHSVELYRWLALGIEAILAGLGGAFLSLGLSSGFAENMTAGRGFIALAALIIGGWRDGLLRGAPEMYRQLARRKGVETRLYIDPCTHKGCGAPFAPFTAGKDVYDASALAFEFLQKHLEGKDTPARPPVEYYVQGRDEYATANSWPPAKTRFRRFVLGSGKREFVTNPAAGLSMAFDRFGTVAASPYVPTDQRLEGPHGFTFRTPVLEKPLSLAGPLALRLVASSTATDTDWHVKVADVAPDGSESIITDGALRASHRKLDRRRSTRARPYHTHTDPQPIEPGRFYEYDVEIWPTAYELAVGHRLQLRLTSTDLPTHLPASIAFDRHDPAATQVNVLSPATNTVKLDESYLLLPVSP